MSSSVSVDHGVSYSVSAGSGTDIDHHRRQVDSQLTKGPGSITLAIYYSRKQRTQHRNSEGCYPGQSYWLYELVTPEVAADLRLQWDSVSDL